MEDNKIIESSELDLLTDDTKPLTIVGIGGSLNGSDSLERFFSAMPAKTEIAFVVLMSTTVHQTSKLIESLEQLTRTPVEIAEDGLEIFPDRIYVCPPSHEVRYEKGFLRVLEPKLGKGSSLPFDDFLESLLPEAGNCAAVLLSSRGQDGIVGCRDLKERGGCVLVEAHVSGGVIKRQAGSSIKADWSLKPENMAEVILEKFKMEARGYAVDSIDEQEDALMNRLLGMIEETTHINFKQYKIATIKRRIANRMRQRQMTSLEFYVEFATRNPEELQCLYSDFMIGVTSFFRDIEAFESLKKSVFPSLFKNIEIGQELRVWVSGCATGEEAYSIAMLIDEYIRENGIEGISYKVFGSDAHPPSIYKSVQGVYREESLEFLSIDQKNRYFKQVHDEFHVRQHLRECVVFAEHNILRDPPFTKIDLLLCRNLLIYFNSVAQKKALCMILFALKAKGFLFLGPSESPSEYLDQFTAVDAKWRIFEKAGTGALVAQMHLIGTGSPKTPVRKVQKPAATGYSNLPILMDFLMEQHLPRSVLVDAIGNIVHVFGDCNPFVLPIKGKASLRLEDRVHPELSRLILIARQKTVNSNEEVFLPDAVVKDAGSVHHINIRIVPIGATRQYADHCYVVFEDIVVEKTKRESEELILAEAVCEVYDVTQSNENVLRTELQGAKLQLEETIRQLEISNQELQMANEELLTSNEELQSTNEELHSVNEELFSVNAEYELKNRELVALNEDVNNLLRSTQIGTVFVEPNLRIRKFTPSVEGILNLLPQDIGRPIAHISHKFLDYDNLLEDIKRVIQSGIAFEREALNQANRWLLVRILPYRTEQDRPNGAVLTFIDITDLKEAEFDVLENQRKLKLALEAAEFGLWNWNLKTAAVEFDDRFAKILDMSQLGETDEAAFLDAIDFSSEELKKHDFNNIDNGTGFLHHSWSVRLKSGEVRYLSGRGIVYRDETGEVERVSGVIWNETAVKRQEQQVLQKKNDLETLLYVISHDLREPLRAIQSFSQLLVSRYREELPEKAGDFVQRIDGGAKRMSTLLEDVLSLSRINTIDTPSSEVSGRQLVDAAMRGLDNKIQETTARVVVASELPEVRVNFVYAKQAIYNLLGNSLKFVNEGEVPNIEISPYVGVDQSVSGLVIRDRGPGIPEDCEKRIFKLFQRAVSRDIEGTGAGLAIVKQIALKHGGDVWYESRVGGGSKFTITFAK